MFKGQIPVGEITGRRALGVPRKDVFRLPNLECLTRRGSGHPPQGRRSTDAVRRFSLGARRDGAHLDRVSLNRSENALLAYLRDHPDETRFWTARVLEIDGAPGTADARASQLDQELRTYVAERTRAEPSLIETLGDGTVSMRNFAEYLLAVWTPPRGPVPCRRKRRS